MQNKLFWSVILVILLAMVLSYNYVTNIEKDTPKVIYLNGTVSKGTTIPAHTTIAGTNTTIADSNTNTNTNTTIAGTNTNTNTTDKDGMFKVWFSNSFSIIANDLDCTVKAAGKKDFAGTEKCANFLVNDSNRSLEQINKYNVSTNLQPVFDQYKESLKNYQLGGEILQIGARSKNDTKMGESIGYLHQGNIGITKIRTLFDNNSSSNQATGGKIPINFT